MKRFLTVLITVILILAGVFASALLANAQEDAVIASGTCSNIQWSLTESGVLTLSGTGFMPGYYQIETLPWYNHMERITELRVGEGILSVGKANFMYCSNLKKVTLPEGFLRLENSAFYACTGLESINFPESMNYIDAYALAACSSLQEITIPHKITTINISAFELCSSLYKVVLPDTLTAIKEYAFYHCESLREINLPNSITSIGNGAFGNCTALETLTLPDGITSLSSSSFSGCSSLRTIMFNENLRAIGSSAFCGCAVTELMFPKELRVIERQAFADCAQLQTVTFPDASPVIASDAFTNVTATCYYPGNDDSWTDSDFQNYGGNLTWVACRFDLLASGTCGDGLTWELGNDGVLTILGSGSIPAYSPERPAPWSAWQENVTQLVLPEGLTEIGDYAFSGCAGFPDVTIPASVTAIGSNAFSGCSALQNVSFAGNAPAIGHSAFAQVHAICWYPSSDATWTDDIFQNYGGTIQWMEKTVSGTCGTLQWILSGDGVLYIFGTGEMPSFYSSRPAPWLAYKDQIRKVILGGGIADIGSHAFENCPVLEEVSICSTVTCIESAAFVNCDSLLMLDIPGSVQKIEGYAFQDSNRLAILRFLGSAPTIESDAFYSLFATAFYPGSDPSWASVITSQYGGSVQWVTLENGLIGEGQCGNCLFWKLDSYGVLTIYGTGEMDDFNYNSGAPWKRRSGIIRSVVVEEGATSISTVAFKNCTNLTNVSIAESVTQIGFSAFSGCGKLTEVSLPENLTTLGGYAFENCVMLRSIQIPQNVPELLVSTFSGCVNLEEVTLPERLLRVGSDAFHGCTKLKKLEIPSRVTEIQSGAFAECTALEEVILPYSLEVVTEDVFSGCSNLSWLIIPEQVVLVESNAFRNTTALERVFFLGDAPGAGAEDYFLDGHPSVTAYVTADALGWNRETWGGATVASWTPAFTGVTECDQQGRQTVTCSQQGISQTRQIPYLNHRYSPWQIILWPSENAEGVRQCACRNCGMTLMEYIESIGQYPATSYSQNDQNYTTYASTIRTYLQQMPDGRYQRISATSDSLISVEYYDANLQFISRLGVQKELPVWGGYYWDGTYHYMVFGQNNPSESDDVEVFQIVKYSESWHVLGRIRLHGANTTVPFDAGSLRMTHSGNILYIRSCHEQYMTGDRLNHQTNINFAVSIPLFKMTHGCYIPGGSTYVSHSFNQFVLADGEDLLAVDHGDAYPRAIVLFRLQGNAGKARFDETSESVHVLPIFGEIGDNTTGVSVGGLEASDQAYLIAGNTTRQDGAINQARGQRNIFITATSKTNFTSEGTSRIWLTHYDEAANVSVSTPHLVRIHSNRFLVLWTENNVLKYTFINGSGLPEGSVYSSENGKLSDCKPIVSGNRVIWFVAEGSVPEFFVLDLDAPDTLQVSHTDDTHCYQQEMITMPTETQEGSMHAFCSLCQNGVMVTLPPLTEEHYIIEKEEPTCQNSGYYQYTWKDDTYGVFVLLFTMGFGNHSYTETVLQAPTCTQPGSALCVCSLCGHGKQQSLAPTGHTYQSVVTEPTYSSQGYTTYTCSVCSDVYQDNFVPALTSEAIIDGQRFASVEEALAVAREGDRVELTADADATGQTLILRPGVTLHLGAYDLIADGFIGFNGSILDATRYSATGDYGKLIVPKENLVLSGGQAAVNGEYDVIPVWNGEDAYILANALVNDTEGEYGLKIDEENKTIRFSFVHKVGGSANNAFFKDGTGDNALKIIIRLEWASGNGVAYQDFVYNDDFVGLVSGGGYNYSFVLNNYDILNIDLSNLKVTAMILTDAGTITAGQVWTQANAIE